MNIKSNPPMVLQDLDLLPYQSAFAANSSRFKIGLWGTKEDQQHVLALCATHPYHEVVEILSRPRPEGLQLKTSYSALCRFNCSQNQEIRKTTVLDQAAASLQYLRQNSAGSFRTAILTLLETRIFEALRTGTPISELKDDFHILKEFQKGFLAEEKWRLDPAVDTSKEASTHHSRCNHNAHYDFVPANEHGEAADIPPLSDQEIASLNGTDDITPEDIAKLDQRIAAYGRDGIERHALIEGYPANLIKERIKAYEENLRTRGISPVQAAIEARRSKLLGTGPNHITIHQNPPESGRKST